MIAAHRACNSVSTIPHVLLAILSAPFSNYSIFAFHSRLIERAFSMYNEFMGRTLHCIWPSQYGSYTHQCFYNDLLIL